MTKAKYNWRHNSLIGTALCARGYLKRIPTAPSATRRAQRLATQIMGMCEELASELRSTRIEPDGSSKDLRKRPTPPEED